MSKGWRPVHILGFRGRLAKDRSARKGGCHNDHFCLDRDRTLMLVRALPAAAVGKLARRYA
jgi:hypothetical protein